MATILVVDDRPDDRQLMVTLLGCYGHTMLEATDAAEALQIAQAQHPDLIISNILMPTMDGYEFVRRLRADPAIAKTAVVFYTANYLEREALAMAQACGISQILSKPCEPAEVMRIVEGVLHLATPPALTDPKHSADGDDAQEQTKQLSRSISELEVDKLRLLALIEFRHRLFTERHPQRLLDGFCHAARELIGAKLAAVGVLGDDGRSWRYSFISGLRPEDMAQTRVIVLSMYANEAYVLEALRNGASGYVLKDSSITDLLQAVREVVAGRRYLSAPLSEPAIEAYVDKAKSRAPTPYESLTNREREVLQLVAEGSTSAQIAQRLYLSPRTVETHRANLMCKLGLRSQADLTRYAIGRGILPVIEGPDRPV